METAKRQLRPLARYFAWSSLRDGRWILLLILLAYFVTFTALKHWCGREAAWETLGVSSGYPSFLDLRFVTGTLEGSAAGFDPYVENPFDPYQRRMNYPRIWLSLAGLGLKERHTVPLGIGLTVIYFAVLLLWAGRTNPIESLLLGLFLCSPRLMWVIERGNVDMVILTLLILALLLARWRSKLRPLLLLMVLFTAILKLYPIAGIWVAARNRFGRAVAWIAVPLLIFAAYLYFTWADVLRTIEYTPRITWWSYGSVVAFEIMEFLLRWMAGIRIPGWWLAAASLAAVAVAGVIAVQLARRLRGAPCESPAHIDAFLVGSGIYAGTFLIGTNFDYKLIFLILLLPQTFEWMRDRGGFAATAAALLWAIMLSVWAESLIMWVRQRPTSWPPTMGVMLQELANWMLWVLIVAINLRLVAQWIRQWRAPAPLPAATSAAGS